MIRFGLIGAAGFVAPRHIKAIKEVGAELVAAVDKHDCVGVMDSYFPDASFFTEFERFDRHVDKLKRKGEGLDYVSVCTPNYLHDAHIRFGLRSGSDVICEKPLVLNPWNIDGLVEIEKETGKKVFNILQLRHHPAIIALRDKVANEYQGKKYEVDLAYFTSRGKWYMQSWKGELEKSGGIATNIGVHFYDMLTWVFGDVQQSVVHLHEKDCAAGFMELEKARVRWYLSINYDKIPEEVKVLGKRTFRSITMNGKEIEFSEGFTDLHTVSYKSVLDGKGFGLEEARKSIELVHGIRNAEVKGLVGDYHPLAR
jgi:UDP-N-acetyl-2-amino-2-deoxyglucuronate dehydrogenase